MDEHRFLARQAGHYHPEQYTNSTATSLPLEPEAISEEEQRLLSLKSRTRFAEARAERNARQDRAQWWERLKRAEMRADAKRIDCFKHTAAIRREVMAIEKLVDEAA